ncbi:MAG: hypothetical protein HY553_21480 [Elusimicrobia bacterium]|nr:hypothetical protein [Elusimicrobiota bacterium]
MIRAAYAGWAGVTFAVLQFACFCLLEERLSSAWPTYAAVTAGWLAGTILGLAAPGRSRGDEAAFAAIAAAAYYAMFLGVRLCPYDVRLLPGYGLLLLAIGGFAGRFFRERLEAWRDPRALFFHENNGFLCGMLLSFGLFYARAGWFLAFAPAATLACGWAMRRAGWDR